MTIDFISPVYPVDQFAQGAFLEILNLILLADSAEELSVRLWRSEVDAKHPRLSGYFKWTFANHSFTLTQRMAYGSERCFDQKVLEVKTISFILADRVKPDKIKN